MNISYKKTSELYNSSLNNIKEISFTFREIDIISCVLHNRGEKKIASILSISPRTVGTHLHNISLKLNHGTREHIIDFIEKSGMLRMIREYYLHLLIETEFKKYLISIKNTISRNPINCILHSTSSDASQKDFIRHLKDHLKLANIYVTEGPIENDLTVDNLLLIKKTSQQQDLNQQVLLSLDLKLEKEIPNNIPVVSFHNDSDYYFSLLKLLEFLIEKSDINLITKKFQGYAQAIISAIDKKENNDLGSKITSFSTSKIAWGKVIVLMAVIICSWVLLKKNTDINNYFYSNNVNNNLPLPHPTILLERPLITKRIKEKLINKVGVQTIALVGIGGTGKTTIARDYMKKSGTTITWEINAETQDSIIASYKKLAYNISLTEVDDIAIDRIDKISNTEERNEQLLSFISEKLRNKPKWLIVFDNVKEFKNIEKYFPYDSIVWGNGSIIITTNDNTILHSNYISDENIINVDKLSTEEKERLFFSIIEKSESNAQLFSSCINLLPPFPLDISLSAHYIKSTNLSCTKYLKHIYNPDQNFQESQKNLLKDIGEYNRTRYDILRLSVEHISDISPDFEDLLFLIGSVHSQEIPLKLLYAYKDDITVNRFIRELHKFSFITKIMQDNTTTPTLSIHRITQEMVFNILYKKIEDKNKFDKINNIASIFGQYIKGEIKNSHIQTIQSFIPHLESFMKENTLINNKDKVLLNHQLGDCYFYVSNYSKSRECLLSASQLSNHYYDSEHIITANISRSLGMLYRNMGDYIKAKIYLENAYPIYLQYYDSDHINTIDVSVDLATVYRNLGNYEESQKLLEHALKIYKKDSLQYKREIERAFAYLGIVYKNKGSYDKALPVLENALITYTKHYGENHTKTGWISVHLAGLYRHLGDFRKSKKLFENSLEIYKNHGGVNCLEYAWTLAHLGAVSKEYGEFPKAKYLLESSLSIYRNHIQETTIIVGWIKSLLGSVYRDINDTDTSLALLESSLKIHQEYFGKDHVKTALVLNNIGKTYLEKHDIQNANLHIESALTVLSKYDHSDRYKCYEALADLYILKFKNNKNEEAKENYNKALSYLEQSLHIVQNQFPVGSQRTKKVLSKIEALKK